MSTDVASPAGACAALHTAIRNGRRFRFPFDPKAIPAGPGIYVMFEEGEAAHGGDRIVRVGKGAHLRRRLRTHFGGTHRTKSVVQRHVGRSLLSEAGTDALSLWNSKASAKGGQAELHLWEMVALERMRTAFSFSVVTVPLSDLDRIEQAMIATVAQCPICRASDTWLGLKDPDHRFERCHMWNVSSLNGDTLTLADIEQMALHVVCDEPRGR